MGKYDCPFFANKHYHVFNHAVGSEDLYLIDENYRFFKQQVAKYFRRVSDLYCFNFLPNHFHIFLRIKAEEELRIIFQELHPGKTLCDSNIPDFVLNQFSNCFNSYTKSFNKWNRRMGRLFMESVKRKQVQDEEYFTKIIHYIHANAVHHGICKRIEDWKYSSYHDLINGEISFLSGNEVLDWFGGLEGFIQFHQQPINLKIKIDY